MHSHNTKSEKRESELGGEARCLCPDPWERRPLCRLLHANPRWRRPLRHPCARIRGGGGLYAAPARGSVGRRPPCEEEGRTPREEVAALRHRACGSEGRVRCCALSSVMREGEQRGRAERGWAMAAWGRGAERGHMRRRERRQAGPPTGRRLYNRPCRAAPRA